MRPIVDICFKELMRNPAVRAGFAAAIMNCRPEEVEETYLMPTYLQNGKEEEKQGILDVRVLLKQGTQIGIEMQVNYFEYWDERILFYLCKMFTEQLMKGDPMGSYRGVFMSVSWISYIFRRIRSVTGKYISGTEGPGSCFRISWKYRCWS